MWEKQFRKTEEAKGVNLNLEKSTQKTTTLLPGQPAPQQQHQGSTKSPPFLFLLFTSCLLYKMSKAQLGRS